MKTKGSRELIWIAITMGVLLAALIIVSFRADRDPLAQIESKSKRIALINTIRLALAATSEEQNCAVLATSELDSTAFVQQARMEAAAFERGRLELVELIHRRNDVNELSLANRVNESFIAFQDINEKLSNLAIENSNRKAYTLAFGPARNLLQAIDNKLSELGKLPSELTTELLEQLYNSRLSVLRIQVLLIPHIAEPSDQMMDELETKMAEDDQTILKCLASLGQFQRESARVERIQLLYKEFGEVKSQIIKLSRENSGLRSVSIALNDKRKAMLACQDALAKLENAISAEPIVTSIPSGRGN